MLCEISCGIVRENPERMMKMGHGERAEALFRQGYNCAQAVFGAWAQEAGLDQNTALRLSSSFGGGLGRLREVCGALAGIEMALGCLYGYDTPETGAVKGEHYARVQDLAEAFRGEFGSILCREILKGADASPNPTPRTEDFYAKRPCLRCVVRAAEILEEYVRENPPKCGQEEIK